MVGGASVCIWEEKEVSEAITVSLPHDLLQSVLKPSRYTGGEWNAAVKEWAAPEVKCRWALALPDVYEVGMSLSLIHI